MANYYTDQMRTLIEAFWPGGLSLVVPGAKPAVESGDTRGTGCAAYALHPVAAIELLREINQMAVQGANISGQVPATAQAAKEQLGAAVNVYLDGGETPVGVASTIIDLSGNTPKILREGAISAERVAEVLELDVEAIR